VVKKDLIKMVMLLNSEQESRSLSKKIFDMPLLVDIIIAKNIEQFFKIILNEQIDCFILDWNYELYNMTLLTEKIRKSHRYRQITLAFVVNQNEIGILKENSALKIDLIIPRPFDLNEFQADFINILNKKLDYIIPEYFEVLVLEDNKDILEIHVEHLNKLQHSRFQTCSSISEAKKLVSHKNYNLMMLDWNLGDGTCIELIEFIREKNQSHSLTNPLIIAITGRNSSEDIMTMLKYGVKDYIIKPFDLLEFEDKLIYALERYEKSLKIA
jgi:DNA-binding response OmpR family regulator